MKNRIPHKIYKYQSLADGSHCLENLTKHQVYFPKPELLNDPFDFRISFVLSSLTEKEWRSGFDKFSEMIEADLGTNAVKQAQAEFLTNGELNQHFKNTLIRANSKNISGSSAKYEQRGVACFAKKFDNILMWSHYADGHRGLCLEFDTRFPPFNDPQKLHKVIYDNHRPTLSPIEFIVNGFIPVTPLITKSRKWEYEKEWRLITPHGNSSIEYDPKALTGIYFGCLMPDAQKRKIATMPANSAPHLFCMKTSTTEFKLEYFPFHI